MAAGRLIEAADRRVYICALVCVLVSDTLFQRAQVFLDMELDSLNWQDGCWYIKGNVEKVGAVVTGIRRSFAVLLHAFIYLFSRLAIASSLYHCQSRSAIF